MPEAGAASLNRAAAAAGSVAFFLVGPGLEAGVGPWVLTRWERGDSVLRALPFAVLGGLLLAAGLAVVLHAFASFVRDGRGTPAPVAPPGRLVVAGAYRYVRNPMYVATAAMIAGQGLLLAQPILLLAVVVYLTAVNVFVSAIEDPALRRRFGDQYERYRREVPGWWPRLRAVPEEGLEPPTRGL